jgi:hypothetical protein
MPTLLALMDDSAAMFLSDFPSGLLVRIASLSAAVRPKPHRRGPGKMVCAVTLGRVRPAYHLAIFQLRGTGEIGPGGIPNSTPSKSRVAHRRML